jgi:4-amino-4-deoxychorismate lyase
MLFETICIKDGEPLNLEYHQQRLNKSRGDLGLGSKDLDLESIIIVPSDLKVGLVRCRIDANEKIQSVVFSRYQSKKINSIVLVEADIEYKHKWSDRSNFERLKSAYDAYDEVIITRQGYLTDATYANIALKQEGIWYTPNNPLLPGTARERLIDQGKLVPKMLHRDNIYQYQEIKLINAMLGEHGASIVISTDTVHIEKVIKN